MSDIRRAADAHLVMAAVTPGEDNTDVSAIIFAYRVANKADWDVAEMTGARFAKFTKFDTQQIAAACNVSLSTVGNWARAWWMFVHLGKPERFRALGLSFFYRAYAYLEVAEKSDLIGVLDIALKEGKSAGWFGAELSDYYDAHEDKHTRRIASLTALLRRVYEDSEMNGMSQDCRGKLKAALDALEATP